jgi:hypothetical protein
MADVTKTVAVQVTSSADTSGLNAAKKDVSQLKAEVADFEKKLDAINAEADAAGQKTGEALTEGVSKGTGKKKLGITNVFDIGSAAGDAWRLGGQIGDGLARGLEATMDGRSFIAGIFGDYDPATDPQAQKIIDGYDAILKKLNAKPEAGGILEWLDEVKRKATEAADEINHLADLRDQDQKNTAAQEDRQRDQRAKDIENDPNLNPLQKEEEKAALEKEKINADAQRRETDRLDEEADALDQFDNKKAELEAAKQAEAELKTRAEVSATAGKSAQGAWNATDEGKDRGQTLSNGLPKLTSAQPMPETFQRNYIAREGQRQGLEDLTDPQAEAKAAEEATKRRQQLETEVNTAAREGQQLRERQDAERIGDANQVASDIGQVDSNLEAKRSAAETAPDPALGQAANSVSQSADRGAQAAQEMVTKVDGAISRLSSALEQTNQRLAQIEARTAQISAQAQTQNAQGKYE